MPKVYPNIASAAASSPPAPPLDIEKSAEKPTVLTVWKKSLLFNCDGFTVYDAAGNLIYRVDNYTSASKSQIVLMDASGNSLLTIRRRKKLSFGDSWLVFDGETTDNPIFEAKKNLNLLNSVKCLARLTSTANNRSKKSSISPLSSTDEKVIYEIEGSYGRRCCAVYDEKRRRMAEIKQKESSVSGVEFGTDIFRLVVQPGLDSSLAMAIVILLDQMF